MNLDLELSEIEVYLNNVSFPDGRKFVTVFGEKLFRCAANYSGFTILPTVLMSSSMLS
jgi:hypothetical protein